MDGPRIVLLAVVSILFTSLGNSSANPSQTISAPTSAGDDLKLKSKIASINALLIREISAGNYGGTTAKLTATVVPNQSARGMSTQMNQRVGESMNKAFSAVNRAIYLKHEAWPKNQSLELGFANKYGGKDGPSAAVAYALILESLISGKKIRSDLACTGDMNSDQTVQPIGGLRDKIRAASKAGCGFVLIPEKNLDAINDMAVDRDLKDLLKVQVISVKKLDDALKVAFDESDPEVSKAIEQLAEVQAAIGKSGLKVLNDPTMLAKLNSAGRAMPNHVSARMIALARQKKLPNTYTVVTSFTKIDEAVTPFFTAEHTRGSVKASDRDDSHSVSMQELRRIRPKLHPRMRSYTIKIENYISAHRSVMAQKSGVRKDGTIYKRFEKALTAVREERNKLLEDPVIKDSLSQ